MDPMTLFAGMNAVGGVASPIIQLLGQRSQQATAAAGLDMQWRNLQMQQQMQEFQREMATAGTTDARGNRTKYVPGVGWVEIATDKTKALLDASDSEELARLITDMPRERTRRDANAQFQSTERGEAEKRLLGLAAGGGRTLDDIEAALTEANLANIRDPVDDAASDINMQLLRSGTGAAPIMEALAIRGSKDTRSALANARLMAPSLYQQEKAEREGGFLNPYGALISRGTAPDGIAFQMTPIGDALSARADRSRAAAGYLSPRPDMSGTGLNNAFANVRASQPNYGAFGAAFTAGLENAWKQFGYGTPANRNYDDINDMMRRERFLNSGDASGKF
jgi:hypothetical protein